MTRGWGGLTEFADFLKSARRVSDDSHIEGWTKATQGAICNQILHSFVSISATCESSYAETEVVRQPVVACRVSTSTYIKIQRAHTLPTGRQCLSQPGRHSSTITVLVSDDN